MTTCRNTNLIKMRGKKMVGSNSKWFLFFINCSLTLPELNTKTIPLPGLWKNSLPQNQSPVLKKLRTADVEDWQRDCLPLLKR